MSELKKAFQQHIQQDALFWDNNTAQRVFEESDGMYIWHRMQSRFNDFQAGYELGKQGEVK